MVDYLNFENVMGQLQLEEEELKRMVSEGQIRAYRDEDQMKFRADDVAALRQRQVSEPTIILPSAGSIGSVLNDDDDDLLLVEEEEDTGDTMDMDFDRPDDTVVPTLDFDAGADSNAETLTEELVFDEGDADDTMGFDDDVGGAATQRIESQATFIDEDDDDLATQALDVEEEEEADFEDEAPADDEMDEDEIGATIAAPRRSGLGKQSQLISGRASGRASARLAAPAARPLEGTVYAAFGPVWAAVVTLTALWMGYVSLGLIDHVVGAPEGGTLSWAVENTSNEVLKQGFLDGEGAGDNFNTHLPVVNLPEKVGSGE